MIIKFKDEEIDILAALVEFLRKMDVAKFTIMPQDEDDQIEDTHSDPDRK